MFSPLIAFLRNRNLTQAAIAGVACGALFVAFAGLHLAKQGLYQDEVLQATGSFAYIGKPAGGAMVIRGIPVLNTSYLGALKTAFYGFYLRVTGNGFSVSSWRALGVGIVTAGILWLPFLARKRLKPALALVGLLLLCSDGAAILTSRHDWGPAALALFFRLVLIGLLLGDNADEPALHRRHALVGVVFGLAVFEKLSSVVLLVPIALAVLLEPARRKPKALVALATGLAIGSLPLVMVNTAGYLENGKLISLADAGHDPKPAFIRNAKNFPVNFLALAAADHPRLQILGQHVPAAETRMAMILLGSLMAVTLIIALLNFRHGPEFRSALALVLSVFGIAMLLSLLPRRTAIHHNIQVIPFHYIAAAAALGGLLNQRPSWGIPQRVATAVLAVNILLVGAQHAVTVAGVEYALRTNESGDSWKREITRIGEFAATRRGQAIFIASDWGVAGAIDCLAQGEPNFVHEVFWNYLGPGDLKRLVTASRQRIIYLVSPGFNGVASDTSARINRDAGMIPGWKEVPPEPEAAALAPVIIVRKFDLQHP